MTIIRFSEGVETECVDDVAAEVAFTLIVNGRKLVSLLCSPFELDAMAVGFLLSEGFLSDKKSLRSIIVDDVRFNVKVEIQDLPASWEKTFHRRTITSGCGQGITFTDARSLRFIPGSNSPMRWLTQDFIRGILRAFRDISTLFKKTGGVHSAALVDESGIILFAEDIGRHNAVDKLLGKAWLRGISTHNKALLSSGRVSGEIMTKVIRSEVPVLISRAAPTCMSIIHAENHGVTLIGFARGNRMNVYSHPLRITT